MLKIENLSDILRGLYLDQYIKFQLIVHTSFSPSLLSKALFRKEIPLNWLHNGIIHYHLRTFYDEVMVINRYMYIHVHIYVHVYVMECYSNRTEGIYSAPDVTWSYWICHCVCGPSLACNLITVNTDPVMTSVMALCPLAMNSVVYIAVHDIIILAVETSMRLPNSLTDWLSELC